MNIKDIAAKVVSFLYSITEETKFLGFMFT